MPIPRFGLESALRLRGLVLSSILIWSSGVYGEFPQRQGQLREPAILRKLTLGFEENQGQAAASIKYLFRGKGYSLALTNSGMRLTASGEVGNFDQANRGQSQRFAIRPGSTDPTRLLMKFEDASSHAKIEGEELLSGRVNYLIGSEPTEWHVNIPTYARVRYKDIYPGIDLLFHDDQQGLEYDFVVSPEASADEIRLHFDDASKVRLNRSGDLILSTSNGTVTIQRPTMYQVRDNSRRMVDGGFRRIAGNTIGFRVGRYDHSKPLIIDPVLAYSTFLGGSNYGAIYAIAVDAAGSAYATGFTADKDFPVTAGVFQSSIKTTTQTAFVAKLNPSGTALEYATYLGGRSLDRGFAIAVDNAGNAYVTGATNSPDFPTTPGAFQIVNRAPNDPSGYHRSTAFVTKLNSTGSALLYSTFLGGSDVDSTNCPSWGGEEGTGIGIDAAGNAYVTGTTWATDFPTTHGAFQTTNNAISAGEDNSFITKLNSTGTALLYSSYLGGSRISEAHGLAVNSAGEAFIGGTTVASDFPVTSGAFEAANPSKGYSPGFVTKMNGDGSGLSYSTYFGGSGHDVINAIAVDSGGNAYLTGYTTSQDFPITAGAFQAKLRPAPAGSTAGDAFVSKLNPTGTGLIYSTYLGGTLNLPAFAIAVDRSGNAYVAGATNSTDFPLTPGALQTYPYALDNGDWDSFLTELNSTGTAILYSTYFGGSGSFYGDDPDYCDCIFGLALDPSNNVYVGGITHSPDFPSSPGAFQERSPNSLLEYNSSTAFVTKFNASEMASLPATTTSITSDANPQYRLTPVTLTASVRRSSGSGVPAGSVRFTTEEALLCDSVVNSSGNAVCSTTAIAAPTWTVLATYSGDPNNAPSTGTIDQTILGIPTTTAVSSDKNSVPYGTAVTFTAYVTSQNGIPTSAVILNDTGVAGVSSPLLDSTGHAKWTTSSLTPGVHLITADYTGDTNYAESQATMTETIQPLGVTPPPTFTPAPGTYTEGQEIALADSSPNAAIYYTTDGSNPSVNSQLYSNTIAVMGTETIKAMAVATGYSESNVVTGAYAIVLPPDFGLALAPQTISLSAGQSGTSTITVTPVNGFNSAVVFSCSGLPGGTSCAFSPSSVTPQGSVSTSTLKISNSGTAKLIARPGTSLPMASLAIALGAFLIRRRRFSLSTRILLPSALLFLALLSSCGGGGGSPVGNKPIPINAVLNITGTSGTLQHSATLNLTIQ
jgi:hypothetical protein